MGVLLKAARRHQARMKPSQATRAWTMEGQQHGHSRHYRCQREHCRGDAVTAFSDEYRGLIEARDALRALLVASPPDSCMALRPAYGVLARTLETDGDRRDAAQSAREEHDRKRPSVDWRKIPADRREAVVFQVLGENALTPREVTAAVNVELSTPGEEDHWDVVYQSWIQGLLKRMVQAGRLTREPEPFMGKFRYRYSRNRTLEGPIADLERAYRDDDGSQEGES